MIHVETFEVAGPVALQPPRYRDARGFFAETYMRDRFGPIIGNLEFVQDNHSRSQGRGVIRGLHFQRPPMAQAKLVRVTRGAVFDVAVDVRLGSPTYGRYVGLEISDENGIQFFIPKGFLHGFCTLTDEVDFQYKVDEYYSPSHDGSVSYSDPELSIIWPYDPRDLRVSAKDEAAPHLKDIEPPFPAGWIDYSLLSDRDESAS